MPRHLLALALGVCAGVAVMVVAARGIALSRMCLDPLYAYGEQAVADNRRHVLGAGPDAVFLAGTDHHRRDPDASAVLPQRAPAMGHPLPDPAG